MSRHIAWVMWGDEPLGGVRRALGNFAAGLSARGWRVSVVCLDEGVLAAQLRADGHGVQCLRQEGDHHARYAARMQGRLGHLRAQAELHRHRQALREGLRKLRPDVVSIYWPDFLPLVGSTCRRLGIPLVWEMPVVPSVHRWRINQRVYAALLAHWRVMPIANSRFTATRLGDAPRLKVVYPPSDPQRFDPGECKALSRADARIPQQALLLGAVARLSPQKSCESLIRTLQLMQQEQEQLHLVFIGGPLDSAYAVQLREQVAALGLQTRVHFLDALADTAPAYAMLDLVISCRHDAEGFGLSIVEAMLMQKPVLVRALGGPAETVLDGETGWHFDDDRPATIASAIRRALAARGQWSAMGEKARRRAITGFALAASIPRYESCLLEHMEGR